jgi:hypothetical protein
MLVSLTVNGTPVSREVDDETLLAVLLREHLGLTEDPCRLRHHAVRLRRVSRQSRLCLGAPGSRPSR